MSFARVAVSSQVVGGVQSAVSSYYGAKAQARQLAFEADMAGINARMAESAAERTMAAGRREVQRSKMQTAGLKSRQRVALAANGGALDEGSAVNVLTTTDYIGEVDANTIEANAIAQAWGHKIDAVNQRSAARSGRSAASSISPGQAAMSSIIGTAGSVATSWYSMKKAGAFDTPAKPDANRSPHASPNANGLKLKANTVSLGGFWGASNAARSES